MNDIRVRPAERVTTDDPTPMPVARAPRRIAQDGAGRAGIGALSRRQRARCCRRPGIGVWRHYPAEPKSRRRRRAEPRLRARRARRDGPQPATAR